jgi:cobalt-zinc-cadmium resistance protein CzcA
MNGIPGRVSMRSISLFGLSQITLVFEDNADNATIRNLASQLLGTVTLPAGPNASLSPDATPIGEFTATPARARAFPRRRSARWRTGWSKRSSAPCPGVVDVNPVRRPDQAIPGADRPGQAQVLRLTLQQVFTALSNSNTNAGGSYVEHGSELYVVRGLGLVRDIADIEAVAVDTRAGTPIRISDIGRSSSATRCAWAGSGGRTRRPGFPGGIRDEDDVAEGIVVMRRGENPVEVCARVEAMAAQINAHYLPPGVRLVMYYDRTALTERTLHTVGTT